MPFCRRSSKGVSFAPNVATVMNAGGEGGASYRDGWQSSEKIVGRRPNGFQGLSLNDRTIIFLVNVLDKTVSVG